MTKKKDKPVVYSALEVANICGVVNQTAINWIKSEYVKAFTTPGGQYRVYPDDLAEFMVSRNMRVPQKLLEECKRTNLLVSNSILIVDDDVGLNSVVAKFLERKFESMQVYQAYDGFDAGVQIAEKRPHCIILDLDLPGIDGFDLCKRINESESFGKPEIIVITALDNDEIEIKLKKMNVRNFFRKPLDLIEIATAVQGIVCER